MSQLPTLDDMRNFHLYGSECCAADMERTLLVIVQTAPGVTSYFHNKCKACGKPCGKKLLRIWDSNGTEIKLGDLIDCPELEGRCDRYQIAYEDVYSPGAITIRDTGANNLNIYDVQPYFTLGSWRNHRDKLEQSDIDYYELERYGEEPNS